MKALSQTGVLNAYVDDGFNTKLSFSAYIKTPKIS